MTNQNQSEVKLYPGLKVCSQDFHKDILKMREFDFGLLEDLIERANIKSQKLLRKFLVETEDFRKTPVYPYLVSSCGRIFNLEGVGRELNHSFDIKEYNLVSVNFLGEVKTIGAHRLIMMGYYGPPHEGFVVNHINGLKGDNRLVNLEYVTPKQNSVHAINMGFKKRVNYFD